MRLPQVHHKVTAETKRFRVQCLGQKNSMLFFRTHVYNLQIPVSDSLQKEVMVNINVLTIRSSHRVVRQVYPPLVIIHHRGTSNIAIGKHETPDIPHETVLANSRGRRHVVRLLSTQRDAFPCATVNRHDTQAPAHITTPPETDLRSLASCA